MRRTSSCFNFHELPDNLIIFIQKKMFFAMLFSLFLLYQSTTFIKTEEEYNSFIENNPIYFLTLCTDVGNQNIKHLATIFDKTILRSNNELKIDFKAGMISAKLAKTLLPDIHYEGFPTIYFFSREGDVVTKEGYIAAKNPDGILKFLKKRTPREIKQLFSYFGVYRGAKENHFILLLPKDVEYDRQVIFEVAKNCGIFEIYEIVDIAKNKMMLMTPELMDELIDIEDFKKINVFDLTHKIKIRIRQGLRKTKEFVTLDDVDAEFALGKHPIPTIFLFYGSKKTFPKEEEEKLNKIALKYANEFAFIKSSTASKFLSALQFDEYFNLRNKTEIPKFVLTTENPHSDDDVEKYIMAHSDYFNINETEGDANSTTINAGHRLSLDEVLEKFISHYKEGKLLRLYTNYYLHKQLNGGNFIPVINDLVNEDREMLLFLVPSASKKRNRIQMLAQAVFFKLSHQTDLRVETFDPLCNEISYIVYDHVPSIFLIKKGFNNTDLNDEFNWNVIRYDGDLNTKDVISWVNTSSNYTFNETVIERQEEIYNWEKSQPFYRVNKRRYEGYALEDLDEYATIGLKRRWTKMKILVNEDLGLDFLNSGNDFVNDESEVEINDDFGQKNPGDKGEEGLSKHYDSDL